MVDLYSVSELNAELKAKERNREYCLDLLSQEPFNWSLRLDVEALDAEIQELIKAICVTNMQQCG